jgi:hypothetical protein
MEIELLNEDSLEAEEIQLFDPQYYNELFDNQDEIDLPLGVL